MNAKLQELKNRWCEVSDLQAAAGVLFWDQATYMPPGGGPARARQLALLSRLAHEKVTDPALGRLLDDLRPYEESLPYDHDDAALIRVARRDYDRLVKVPTRFVAELTTHQAKSYQVWAQARPANDFTRVRPYLEKTLELSQRYAGYYAPFEHIADPLIDEADYGLTVSILSPLFAALRAQLVPLVQAITAQTPADDRCLRGHFPEPGQLAFGLEVARQLGYDLSRGRLDKTHHPFSIGFAHGDVRITTRVDERNLSEALFSTIHEAGHAMYEQGVRPEFEGTPLHGSASAGVDESQSRLWENIVGRGRAFWQFYFPRLQAIFPDQLGQVSLEAFYRAINRVTPSLIRVDADEVTYNLHVMIRFDLELQLLEGKLAVRDLPEAWRVRCQADLGVAPPDDKDGVMQDMHWFGGVVGGMFQGYTLGNVMSALFYDAAVQARPEIPDQIAHGHFSTLLRWLQQNIYQHGRKFTAAELVQRVTGGPLRIEPYTQYLKAKYGELYRL
jgi:carboxypeptidase Taq